MSADPALARELKLLQEEVAALRRERISPSASVSAAATAATAGGLTAASGPAAAAAPPQETGEERELRSQLAEFADQITQFFEQAEQNIVTHPAESVAGALIVGILIGRLLGRR